LEVWSQTATVPLTKPWMVALQNFKTGLSTILEVHWNCLLSFGVQGEDLQVLPHTGWEPLLWKAEDQDYWKYLQSTSQLSITNSKIQNPKHFRFQRMPCTEPPGWGSLELVFFFQIPPKYYRKVNTSSNKKTNTAIFLLWWEMNLGKMKT
jgi:hypothetical protein